MLKEFFNNKIIVFATLFSLIPLLLILPEVDASLYSYDETTFNVPWTTVTNGIILHNSTSNESVVYSQTVTTTQHTFTKVLGTWGQNSLTLTSSCTVSASCGFRGLETYGNMIGGGWSQEGNGPDRHWNYVKSLNATDGVQKQATVSFCNDNPYSLYSSTVFFPFTLFILDESQNYEVVGAGSCQLNNVPSRSSGVVAANGTSFYSNASYQSAAGGVNHGGVTNHGRWGNGTSSTNAVTTTAGAFGSCDSTTCSMWGQNNSTITRSLNFATALAVSQYSVISPELTQVRQGIDVTPTIDQRFGSTGIAQANWEDNLYDQDVIHEALNLHHIILGESTPGIAFIFTVSGVDYFGYTTTTGIKYTALSNITAELTDRAVQSYGVDNTSVTLSGLPVSSALPAVTYSIVTPTTTSSSDARGFFSLISGYNTLVPTITSTVNPSLTNYEDNPLIPWIVTPTGSTTALTVEIKNLRTDYTIMLKSPNTLAGENYVWDTVTLDAGGQFTVDLPSGTCVEVVVFDASTNPVGAQESLGQICASGAMPKVIIYSANLAFTFWTLPFGASHTFSETGDILTTRVRSDTNPFDYTVKIYHSNGTLYNSTLYSGVTTNSTTFDLRTFNASGADYPSRIEIYDDNNSLVYYATIGFPNYFSSVASFFAQWFVVEGFNLLYMLPIVFAAMFTRNTVGIGTGLTVVLISVLAWFGLIVIDEVMVYLLIFIAIIGLLAYRTLR
ncbi:hypothetical protein [Nitrosopumilus spindle-shaped virus]|uniref:Uncharacterized protein n=1 Tax=Nitrosopumilus spindle-shaped virus TaxID=2508184 RepID=A0A514K393_9VIRU|nr:hypothetical protein [Nitrosopumilus spindle-shaped virus]